MRPLSLAAALLLAAHAAAADLPQSFISLDSVAFDAARGEPPVPQALRAAPSEERFLVKLRGPARSGDVETIAKTVQRVYGYVPHHAFLVRATEAQRRSLAARLDAWVGPYHPLYKISRRVQRVRGDEPGLL